MRAGLLILAGVVYLGLVFFYGLESPLFAIGFIALAGNELVQLRKRRRF